MADMNRDRFFEILGDRTVNGRELVQRAYWLSKNVHRVQMRDSGERYFEHPRRVALILAEQGLVDPDIMVTALLHDVLEDTFTPSDVLLCLFGCEAYRRLEILSKQMPAEDRATGQVIGWAKKDTEDYYLGLRSACKTVRLVKCADRLDNLRTCHVWPQERVCSYVKETERLVMPLAQATDPFFCDLIESEVGRIMARTSDCK